MHASLAMSFEALRARVRPWLATWRRARLHRRLPRHVTAGFFCDLHPTVEFIAGDDSQPIVIGDWVRIRAHGELLGPITIGSRTRINRHVYIRPHTTLGCDVMIGAFVRFLTDNHEMGDVRSRLGSLRYDPIVIGDGAWIGAGVMVLPGRRIGKGAVVGAGSVVTKNVPPDTVWAGNPARMLRELAPLRTYPPEVFGTGARSRFRPPPGLAPLPPDGSPES